MAETINGVPVPAEVEAAGREAIHQWWTEFDQPAAEAALKASGLSAKDIVCTGAGGKMLSADVERALLAKKAREAEAAKAGAPTAKPAAAPQPQPTPSATTQEG